MYEHTHVKTTHRFLRFPCFIFYSFICHLFATIELVKTCITAISASDKRAMVNLTFEDNLSVNLNLAEHCTNQKHLLGTKYLR